MNKESMIYTYVCLCRKLQLGDFIIVWTSWIALTQTKTPTTCLGNAIVWDHRHMTSAIDLNMGYVPHACVLHIYTIVSKKFLELFS